MTNQGAVNIAKGNGYFISYCRNPKGYEVAKYHGEYKEVEFFGTYNECMSKLAEIGFTLLECMMGF